MESQRAGLPYSFKAAQHVADVTIFRRIQGHSQLRQNRGRSLSERKSMFMGITASNAQDLPENAEQAVTECGSFQSYETERTHQSYHEHSIGHRASRRSILVSQF